MPAKKKEEEVPASDIVTLVPASAPAIVAKTPKERAVIVLRATEREVELAELVKKSADIIEVKNADGRAQVHRMAMELKNTRCEIENGAKEARDDSTKFSKAVIEVERELIAIIKDEETRVFKLRDDFDAVMAAEKAAKEKAEAERAAALAAKVEAIRAIPVSLVNADSTAIRAALTELAARELTEVEFGAKLGEANLALEVAGQKLMAMLADAVAREKAEAERIAAAKEAERKLAEQAEANRKEEARLAGLRREHELADAERQRKADIAAAAAQAEAQKLADARAQLEADMAAFQKQREAALTAIEPEAVNAAIAAEEAPPDAGVGYVIMVAPDNREVMQLFAPAADPAHELSAMIESIPMPSELESHVYTLRQAIRRLIESGIGPDGVRAIVESELLA